MYSPRGGFCDEINSPGETLFRHGINRGGGTFRPETQFATPAVWSVVYIYCV